MNAREYQESAMRTECDQQKSKERYNDIMAVRLSHAVIGMVGEVGEIASAVERWVYYGRDLDVTNLLEETGDLLWYVTQVCAAAGFTLEDAMGANIRKLSARYPDKYTDDQAANRDPGAERRALVEGNIEQDGHGFGHVEYGGEGG